MGTRYNYDDFYSKSSDRGPYGEKGLQAGYGSPPPATHKPSPFVEKPDQVIMFNPIATQRQQMNPVKAFEDHTQEKERNNKAKEKRVHISVILLTFLGSVCILFGTLYPEIARVEIDMIPWRSIIQATAQRQGWLIRDRITVFNIGLWRYCYDDQLYDLIEIVNPQFSNLGRRRRSAENESEFEIESLEKREVAVAGDIAIRCHPTPEPWKMPYYLDNKLQGAQVVLIIAVVACVLSFLLSILVLITRMPLMKLILFCVCFIGVAATATAIGLQFSSATDAEWYINEASARSLARILREDFGLDVEAMSINTKSSGMLILHIGVCSIFLMCALLLMFTSTMLTELSRQLG